jgi:regulator of sirC expression with transglutaminase-like and TPR domain
VAERSHLRAARVVRRLTQLMPHDAEQRRDLGLLLVQSDRYGPAIDHLRHYLGAIPDADDGDAVRKVLHRALGEVARWN